MLELDINIKYFDADYPKLEEISVGDLIDLRSRKQLNIKQNDFFTHSTWNSNGYYLKVWRAHVVT
jgi:hypothetical protein